MAKCQKDPTCGIFLKRGLFKGIKNDNPRCQTRKYKNTNTKYTNTSYGEVPPLFLGLDLMYCMSAGSKHSNAHSLIIKFKSPPNCVQFSFLINIPHCRCTKVKIELFGNLKEISMIFQETFFAGAKGMGGRPLTEFFGPFLRHKTL